MGSRIQRITLNAFRGATRKTVVEFDKQRNFVVLFGENGCGKSTILDAIDAAINGEKGSLSQRSSVSVKEHVPAIGSEPKDVEVVVEVEGGSWRAKIKGDSFESSGSGAKPVVRTLHRNMMLKLVFEQPKERFKIIEPFIDLHGVEASETRLRALIKALAGSLKQAVSVAESEQRKINEWWAREKPSHPNALAWAEAVATTSQESQKAEITQLDELTGFLAKLEAHHAELNGARARLSNAHSKLNDADQELQKGGAIDAKNAETLVDLLQQAGFYVSSNLDATSCPVCEQTVVPKELQKGIATRLAAMSTIVGLVTAKKEATKEVTKTLDNVAGVESKFVASCTKAMTSLRASSNALVTTLKLDQAALNALLDERNPSAARLKSAEVLYAQVSQLAVQLSARRDSLQRVVGMTDAVRSTLKSFKQNIADGTRLEKLIERAKSALEITEQERKAYAESIFEAINTDMNALYDSIHPDEEIGRAKLALDQNTQGSLLQTARFHTKDDVVPQGFYSDSHLDTLGLCIWIAIQKLQSPTDKVLVIDDVFSSVDGPHMQRIAEMLANVAGDFEQVIVATHFRPMLEMYRYSKQPTQQAHVIELRHWSVEAGILIALPLLVSEELAELLKPEKFHRANVASTAGILVEGLFDFLTLLYEVSLPRRKVPTYTLSELLGGVSRLMKKFSLKYAVAVQDKDAGTVTTTVSAGPDLPSIYTKLFSTLFVRNQVGGHYNEYGQQLSDSIVREFGELALQAARALACPKCGQMAVRAKLDHYECHCGHLHMHPFEAP